MGANHGKVKKHQADKIVRKGRRDIQGNMYGHKASQCHGCRRRAMEYTDMGDGRKHCPDCYVRAVMDEEDLEPLIENVNQFFKKKNLVLERHVPVYPVFEQEMIDIHLRAGEKVITRGRYGGLTTMGNDPIQVVTSLSPNLFVEVARKVTEYCRKEVGELEVVTETKELSNNRKKKKCSILILFGLPWLNAGAVLAHEMLHAWFIQRGLRTYSVGQEVEEGLCQLISHIWISEQPIAEHDYYTRSLRDALYREIEQQPGIYGTGFRKAKVAFEKFNNDLEALLSAVTSRKRFPS